MLFLSLSCRIAGRVHTTTTRKRSGDERSQTNAGLQILIAVIVKNSIFWDITPCGLLEVKNQCSGTKSKPIKKPGFCLLYPGYLFGLLFDAEDGGDMFLRNIG
jgi:hypothetical protein